MKQRQFRKDDRLYKILDIDRNLDKVKDIDLLLESLLLQARREARADAGTVYMCEGKKLAFTHAQNDTLQAQLKPHEKLPYSYFTMPINDESISGFVAKHEIFLNIPDMYTIDKKLPYSFNPLYDGKTGYKTVSSLTFPLISSEGELLGVMQLLNAKDDNDNFIPFKKHDIPFFEIFARFGTKAIQRAKMTRNLLETISRFAGLRDPLETGMHVNRVGAYSMEIYEAWSYKNNIKSEERDKKKDIMRMVAMLHDVGKVGISDTILKKKERFDDHDYQMIQAHTWIGAQQFFDDSEMSFHAREVALHHHENWDGSGYPGRIENLEMAGIEMERRGQNKSGLKGYEIPLFARIVALADVFDALSSPRVYKEPWSEEEVLAEIRKESGHKFDPELVEIFFSILSIVKSIQNRYSNSKS